VLNIRRDPESIRYFPSKFIKRDPPSGYFWPVISVILRNDFEENYGRQLQLAKKKIRKPNYFEVTQEHLTHIQARKEENIRLCLELKKTGAEKNITDLRKSNRKDEIVQEGPIDRFLNPQGNQNNSQNMGIQENNYIILGEFRI